MSKNDAKDNLAKIGHQLESQVQELQRKLSDAERSEAQSDYEAGQYGLNSSPVEPIDGIDLDWKSVRISESSLDVPS